jgi:surface antigen
VSLRLLLLRVLGCLLILGSLETVGAGSASADNVRLCSGYTACANAGMSASGYATARNTMYWRMYSGHNCTNYAAYRMVRSGLPNLRPWTGSGNATNWGVVMSRITNQTPTVGAVAWWRAYVSPAGSAGHVAYVEKVISPTEIIVSQDSWGGDFSWARITKGRGWPSGFVHFNDITIQTRSAPVVSGIAKVGGTLTATPGTWSVPGLTTKYQWKVDGVALPGATTSTLKLAPAQQGHKISVTVSVSRTGYASASLTTPSTAAVLPGVLSNPVKPTVTGTPRVGLPLTATLGTWNPAPTALAGQWLADGVPVPGATSTTWIPSWKMVGKKMSFQVTASRTGYTPVKAVAAPATAVEPGQMSITSPATMTGTAALGSTIQVTPGSVSPVGTATVQWLRGGVAVPGATTSSYTITKADLGSRIRAQVTWARQGYTTVVEQTGSTAVLKSTPLIRVSATPGRGRVALSIRVYAPGVRPVPGQVRIWHRGQVIKLLTLRDGAVTTTVGGFKPGQQSLTVRYLGDPKVARGGLAKSFTIR